MNKRTQRKLDTVYGLIALGGLVIVIWERLNPDGPQDAWQRLQSRWQEYRGYREAMQRTLDEIADLPEAVGSPLPSENPPDGS